MTGGIPSMTSSNNKNLGCPVNHWFNGLNPKQPWFTDFTLQNPVVPILSTLFRLIRFRVCPGQSPRLVC